MGGTPVLILVLFSSTSYHRGAYQDLIEIPVSVSKLFDIEVVNSCREKYLTSKSKLYPSKVIYLKTEQSIRRILPNHLMSGYSSRFRQCRYSRVDYRVYFTIELVCFEHIVR